MKIYLKWTFLVFGPFLLIAAGLVWYVTANPEKYSRDDLDESYNSEQVERLQFQKAEKARLDQEFRKSNDSRLPR